MKKKHPGRSLLIAVPLILLYFIVFPYPLGRETVARPVWAVQLPSPGSGLLPAASPGDPSFRAGPFQLGSIFGYVDAAGNLLTLESTQFRVALSETGYVSYTRLGTDWILRAPGGGRLLSFSGSGYPLLSRDGNRIFIVKTDLTGMIELDRNGVMLWNRDFPALATCASFEGDFLLVGLINGALMLVNRQGSAVFETGPAGSRIPVILGCAVSPDGSKIAAVSGIDPQYLLLLQKKGSTYAPREQRLLSSDFRREARVAFSPDSRYLAFEGERSAGVFDPVSRRFSWVPLRGPLAGITFIANGRDAAFLARDGARCELCLVTPFTAPVSRESFPAGEVFLGGIDGQILLGIDDRVARIDVGAM